MNTTGATPETGRPFQRADMIDVFPRMSAGDILRRPAHDFLVAAFYAQFLDDEPVPPPRPRPRRGITRKYRSGDLP